MKAKLYLETTIPSYLVALPSRSLTTAAEQALTHEWWRQRRSDFEIYISQAVLDEIAAGDPMLAKRRLELVASCKELHLNNDVRVLTKALIQGGPLPAKATVDATHLAAATVHRMDFLLTWNCRHLANAAMFRQVQTVCARLKYQCPVVCTPRELLNP